MFTGAPIRLTARFSVALLKYSKPAPSPHNLFPNGLTRSFISSSRVAYAPEQTETESQEDSQASEKKPKKARKSKNASASEAEKPTPHAKKRESPAQKLKIKPVTITADMLPPPIPAHPFARFFKDWHSKGPKPQSLTESASRAKVIAAEWHALSDSEKQSYYESYRAEREVQLKKRQEWFDQTDSATLKELNKARKHQGKKQIRNPNPNPSDKPLTPFILFAADYRRGQAEKLTATEMGRRAGEAWRALSDTEKQQYYDRYRNEMDAWRARNTTAASA